MKVTVISILEKHNSKIWGNIFRVPDEKVEQFVEGKDRRVLCQINSIETIHCALMPSPEGYFIMLNQQLVKKLKLQQNEKVTLVIEKDRSKYGMPISEAFEHIVIGDEQVFTFFDALSPGKKRNLIHLVNSVKNPDSQINRSMAIAEHLLRVQGQLDFKMLNETIKEFNQRNKLK